MEQLTEFETLEREKITDLQQSYNELEKLYLALESIIENSTDAIQISDQDLVTIRVNKAYEILTGIKREELIGKPVQDLVGTMISESCGAIVRQTQKPHTILQYFYRTNRTAYVSCNPVFDSRGNIAFYICNDRDLDEIRRLQTELKETKKLNERYRFEIEAMKSQLPVRTNLIAEDKKMLFVLMLAHRVAQVDSTVLILGETGTGKDEIAKYIHQNSSRADRNFVDVNCGAITESLFESELFGHEKYAFTGAGNREKIGLLEAADHGTLFLDEIGELSLNMQTKLLRVLQNQSFKRVGGVKPIHVDVRIISATNCDLGQMVQEKKFREDLYYRLNVISIKIPPLRERPDDIIPLAQYFLAFYNRKYGFSRKLSPTACVNLLSNRWVGNVRELKNVVEQSVIMAETDTIDTNNLLVNSVASMQFFNQQEPDMGMAEIMERMELQFLSASYEKYGNVRDAAKHLGLAPSTYVRHKKALMRKYPTPQSII